MKKLLLGAMIPLTLLANTKGLYVKDRYGNNLKLPYNESHALLIGVSDYTNGWPNLESIPSELNKVEQKLKKLGFKVTKVMNPNSKELEDSFDEFVDNYGYEENNRLLFFYSGHGYSMNNGKKGFLVPSDAPNPNIDKKNFLRKSYNMTKLLALSRDLTSKHALFLFDSCFSGTIFKTKALPKAPKYIQKSMVRPVRQFITAGSAGEEVPAKSTFTPMFIDAIDGQADLNEDSYITGKELGLYLAQNLPNYSNQNPQYGTIKDYDLAQGDFIFKTNNIVVNQESKEKESSKITFITPNTFSLKINTIPYDARVQILNIIPKYYDGIELKKATYKIKVSKSGYESKRFDIDLKSDVNLDIKLQKLQKSLSYLSQPKDRGSYIEPAMVYIKRGSFMMGSNNGDSDEKPVHKVNIKRDFYMGKYEVSVGEFEKFINNTNYQTDADKKGYCYTYTTKWVKKEGANWKNPGFYQSKKHPVTCVSWNDAKAYAKWLSKKTNRDYDLPSETQWEYVARAGTTTKYSFGNSESDLKYYAWYYNNSNNKTHKVGEKKANPWGVYDIHGNVWEWCDDWYEGSYSNTPRDEKAYSNKSYYKVLKGGSWYNNPNYLRSAGREWKVIDGTSYNFGFRLISRTLD